MSTNLIHNYLSDLPLGPLRYFDRTGSTNEEGARWAEAGAPHLALVVADEQTAGRGRLGRRWFTPPGAALAFSLVLRPGEILQFAQSDTKEKSTHDRVDPVSLLAIPRLAGLGSLAVCTALETGYGLLPQIKWPNDVLLGGRKVCGVLPELNWQGELLLAVILGIGINIAPESVPQTADLLFPATSMDSELDRGIDRWALLRQVLSALLGWLARLAKPDFQEAWESRLAYRSEWVQLFGPQGVEAEGRLIGLSPAGNLRLQLPTGGEGVFQSGELSLRHGADRLK